MSPLEAQNKHERSNSITIEDDQMLMQKMLRQNSMTVRNMLREKFQTNMTEKEQKKVAESSILAFNQNFL